MGKLVLICCEGSGRDPKCDQALRTFTERHIEAIKDQLPDDTTIQSYCMPKIPNEKDVRAAAELCALLLKQSGISLKKQVAFELSSHKESGFPFLVYLVTTDS
jgi:hypothetical protein